MQIQLHTHTYYTVQSVIICQVCARLNRSRENRSQDNAGTFSSRRLYNSAAGIILLILLVVYMGKVYILCAIPSVPSKEFN